MDYLRRTWATINLDAIVENYREIRSLLQPTCNIMAVVKANAYGHGDGYVARLLQSEGAQWFAVSNINEAYSLRKQGIDRPILILGYTPVSRVVELSELKITQTLLSLEYAKDLSQAASTNKVVVDTHVSVDTGMTRLGFYAQHHHESEAAMEIMEAYALPGIQCTGIYTHFSSADDASCDAQTYTEMQYDSFQDVIHLLEDHNIYFALKHCCNSAATLTHPDWHLDMVRPGIILYGLSPSKQMTTLMNYHPAMSLYSTLARVMAVDAGVSVSYERLYTTHTQGQRIATIEAGYDDGFRRNFTNQGMLIINGHLAPVVGAVCMDQFMVDVSGIPNIKEGNLVTLVGSEGNVHISFDDYADMNHSINYEEICLITRRVPRVFYLNNKIIGVIDYVLNSIPKEPFAT